MNRYRIDEVIGRGGMGAVYRARDLHLAREVAVKVITVAAPDRAAHERLRARFHREARAAAALHHPSVVAVHDFGTDPALSLDFIVMEMLHGQDLARHLERNGSPALGTSLSILEQAARGLAAGHRAGLIHRDVKPGNLFVENGDRSGEVRVKVLDFGIAEVTGVDSETMTHLTIAGHSPCSPAFASPEQLRGEPRLTPATDVFSLGAIAFHLFTGRRPFVSAEPRQMVVEISRTFAAERARLGSLSADLPEVLQRALAPSAVDRFPHAGAFADAVASLVPHAPRVAQSFKREERASADETCDGVQETMTRAMEWPPLQIGVFASAPPALLENAAPLAPTRRVHWLRRAGAAVWSFLLTSAATAFFGAAWIAAFTGVQNGDLEFVYMGAAASILATPFAAHRLMGRRGSAGLCVFGSLAATLACVYWLGDRPLEVVLGTVFAVQVMTCVAVQRLTSRGSSDPAAVSDLRTER